MPGAPASVHHVRMRHTTMPQRSDRPARRTIAALLAAATGLGVAACGGSDGDGDGVDLASGLPSAAVCNGEPSDVNPPSSEPFSGYVYVDDGTGWTTGWFDLFGDQHAIVGDDATAILCVNVTESTEAERCEYERDGDTFTLVMASATYDIELRNADTANVIATDTLTVDAEPCPGITSWTEGDTERTSYPRPTDEQVQAALGPFIG